MLLVSSKFLAMYNITLYSVVNLFEGKETRKWAKLSLWTGHVRGKWDRVHVGTRITGLTSRQ